MAVMHNTELILVSHTVNVTIELHRVSDEYDQFGLKSNRTQQVKPPVPVTAVKKLNGGVPHRKTRLCQ